MHARPHGSRLRSALNCCREPWKNNAAPHAALTAASFLSLTHARLSKTTILHLLLLILVPCSAALINVQLTPFALWWVLQAFLRYERLPTWLYLIIKNGNFFHYFQESVLCERNATQSTFIHCNRFAVFLLSFYRRVQKIY